MENLKKVDLTTINNGAAVDLFQEEFEKVMRNINDISIECDTAREIRMVFKIKPNRDRSSAVCTIQASTKLASIQKHESSIFLSRSGAFVTDPRQMDFIEEQSNKPE